MSDDVYKFPTINGEVVWPPSSDGIQFLSVLDRLRNAPVYLNGQLVEITKLELPPLRTITFGNFEIDTPIGKCGFVFKDGHTEYAAIKHINVVTGPEPRIEITTDGLPERTPFQ
jgi:hypothetical protein